MTSNLQVSLALSRCLDSYLSLFDFSQLRLINVLPEQAVLDKDTSSTKQAGEEVSL